MIYKITLFLLFINHPIHSEKARHDYKAVIQEYAAKANIEITFVERKLKERRCTKNYNDWEKRNELHLCLKRYSRKSFKYTLAVLPSLIEIDEHGIKWLHAGGVGTVCKEKNHAFALYGGLSVLPDTLIAVHEIFHMVGAVHTENDPLEIMYPNMISPLVEKNGGVSVSDFTKNNIKECLQ